MKKRDVLPLRSFGDQSSPTTTSCPTKGCGRYDETFAGEDATTSA